MQLIQIASSLQEITGVPVSVFSQGTAPHCFPQDGYVSRALQCVPIENALPGQNNAESIMTEDFLCCGRVNDAAVGEYMLLGPVPAIRFNNEKAQNVLRAHGLPTTEAGQLLTYLRSVPTMSLRRFTKLVLFANYTVNREEAELTTLLPVEYLAQMDVPTDEAPSATETFTIHNAQDYERRLYSLVWLGQYTRMKELLSGAPPTVSEGMLSGEWLRHQRNLVICSTTLAARAAVRGGVEYDSIMSLADIYIQRVEMAEDLHDLSSLHASMLLDFTRMVANRRMNEAESAIASRVQRYVLPRLSEGVSVESIAQALGMNRTYLSSKFRKETGMPLREYINRLRIDEATRLILTTDLPFSEIAAELAFSSQSHMTALFRKHTGKTPAQVRKETGPV